jgi:predicted transcriptional regulator of viral defense system
MQYIELRNELKDFTVFSTKDIIKVDSGFHSQRLSEWQSKKYIQKITKDNYIFADLEISEPVLFIIANKIYNSSYISLEMALSFYNLIPESVYGITSATSLKTKAFNTTIGKFIYRHIKPELIFGYKLVKHQNQFYKIAEIEKAFLDYFYLNSYLKSENEFFEIRINTKGFNESIDTKKFQQYLELFKNRSLENRIKKFIKYNSHA